LTRPISLLKADPEIPTIPARDIQDTDKVYLPAHLQILMEATRGHAVKHLTVQQQPHLLGGNLEALLYHRDTDVLLILRMEWGVGDNAGRAALVIKKVPTFLYFTPVLLAWYEIVKSILPTFTGL
jgi:hypothetical protein